MQASHHVSPRPITLLQVYRRLPTVVRFLLFTLAYAGGVELAFILTFPITNFLTFWPAGGLFVAALLLADRRDWPLLCLGAYATTTLLDALHGRNLLAGQMYIAGNCIEALTGAWLVRHYVGQPSMARLKDVIGLTALSAVVGTALCATIGVSANVILLGGSGFFNKWFLWWSSNMLGVLFQLSRSRSTYKISLDLHIFIVVFSLAGLRAHFGDWQRTKLRPVFTLAGPIQRDLQEKTAALTNSLADLHTARAQLNRQIEVISQQDDRIRGLVTRNTELTRQIEHLQQDLATLGTEPLQRAAAALTARLEGEQLLVLDLQQKLQELQPVCDARVRAAEAFVDKQNEHIQYLKRELRRAGVGFNENWGVGNQGCAA